jgi:hypothetical protein
MTRRVGTVWRFVGILALVFAVAFFAAACSDEGRAKVKAAASSLAPGGSVAPTQLPASPGEASPEASATDDVSPEESESPEPSPSETTESPSPRPTRSTRPSASPLPTEVESSAPAASSESPSGEAGGDESSTAWIWVVLAVAFIGLMFVLAARGRTRGKAAAGWKSRAGDPYSRGVVLHDRLASELAAPEMTGTQVDEALTEFDGISQQLNALSLDAPDDRARQALSELLMTMGTLRPTLEQVKLAADPIARQQETGLARGRLADFDAALRAFRSTVWPETTPPA